MSLISKFILQLLPVDMYSIGDTTKLRVLTYASEGKTISTTEVKITLNGFLLKLSTINVDLNKGSVYSFSTPAKWRACTGNLITSHSGKVSILLGSDPESGFNINTVCIQSFSIHSLQE